MSTAGSVSNALTISINAAGSGIAETGWLQSTPDADAMSNPVTGKPFISGAGTNAAD